MEDNIVKFDKDTPAIVAANKVQSVMAVNKDTGEVGNVAFDLLVQEAGKNVADTVKVTGNVLPTLGSANKRYSFTTDSTGRTLTYGGASLVYSGNKQCSAFWDGTAKTWTKEDEVELPKGRDGKTASTWLGQDYSNQAQVFYNGATWELAVGQNAIATDVPGISNKWVLVSGSKLTKANLPIKNLFDKSKIEKGKSVHLTNFSIVVGIDEGFSLVKVIAKPNTRYSIEGRKSVFAVRNEDSNGNLITGITAPSHSFNPFEFTTPANTTSFYLGTSRIENSVPDGQDFDKIVIREIVTPKVEKINDAEIIAAEVKKGVKDSEGKAIATEEFALSQKAVIVKEATIVTNLFDPSKVISNASISTTSFSFATGQAAGFNVSNKISVIGGHRYRIEKRTSHYAIRWEDSAGELISGDNISGSANYPDATVKAPNLAVAMYFGASRADDGQLLSNIIVTDLDAIASEKCVKTINGDKLLGSKVIKGVKDEDGNTIATEEYVDNKIGSQHIVTSNFNISKLGALSILNLRDFDILHLVEYGQSLSIGSDSNQALTTVALPNNFMLGSRVTSNNSSTYNPLINSGNNEDAIVSATNVFSTLYRRHQERNKSFLATSAGVGGQVIDALSKNSIQGSSYYSTSFLAQVNNAKLGATSQGKTIGCPAIIYIQGESDYGTKTNSVANDAATATERIALYKQRLIQLKNDMQADIMSIYGQSEKPLFFVHNPMGSWSSSETIFVHMAQIQACDENPDMILIGSPCFAPRFKNEHLSANGYRWYGEMIGKALSSTLIDGYKFEPLRPKKHTVVKNKIYIEYYVPVEPLRFNIWTVKETANYGFNILVNGAWINPVNVAIHNSNTVVITMPNDLETASSLTVKYGSRNSSDFTVGTGNLCDSDNWNSMYNYAPDSAEVGKDTGNSIDYRPLDKIGGSVINGKPYPMQNWCLLTSDKIK